MYQRGRASREADCRRMRVLRHVVWGGLPGESKGLSYSRGEDARPRSGGDLQTVLVDLPLPWPLLREFTATAAESRSKNTPVTHSTVAGVLRSIAAASDLLAVRRSLRPFAGAALGPPPPCDVRACACITWRRRASRVGVYVASRKDTHHGGGEGQSGTTEQGDLPPTEQVVEPTRGHRPHGGQQIAHALRHA